MQNVPRTSHQPLQKLSQDSHAPATDTASWQWSTDRLRAWQLKAFNEQLQAILPHNRFYADKIGIKPLQLAHLDDLVSLPLTTKEDLVKSQQAHGLSAHHTFQPDKYVRLHRTSGTSGQPLIVQDTAQDWQWWADTWQHVLAAGDISKSDRVFMAFSFGPFIGFWSAYEACSQLGAQLIPGGGLSTLARLEFMRQSQPTVITCTPSYALQLATVAAENDIDLRSIPVRRIIVAGEPGGSIAAVRSRIESAWHAQVVDHSGATEIGPWGFGWPDQCGIHVIETSFIAELLPAAPALDPSLRELVLTSLGRWGAPVIRYRTGDLVRAQPGPNSRCNFLWLDGGIVGRADDMLVVRGVNVFPSSIAAVVERFPNIHEYRATISQRGQLDDLILELETDAQTAREVCQQLDIAIGLRIEAITVPPGSLPRSEGKARRWLDRRITKACPSHG